MPIFLCGLFLLFLGLKLTDYIDWSWWWVSSPLMVLAALYLLFAGFATFVIKKTFDKW